VCSQLATSEASYLDAITSGEADVERAYERSTGVCVPHLMLGLEHDGAGGERLVKSTLAKWDALRGDLDRFVAKHEYRNVERFSEREASSYARASEVLAGRRHVF